MEDKRTVEGLRERPEAGSVGDSIQTGKQETAASYEVHAQVAAAQVSDILRVLLLFRFLNALCVRTFFQPDEYFQALEPAWSFAFGSDSGAWLTWVHFESSVISSFVCPDVEWQLRNGSTSSDHRFTQPSSAWHTRRLKAS